MPWSTLAPADVDGPPAVDPSRFRPVDDEYPHNWTPVGVPRAFEPSPETAALAGEIRVLFAAALEELPERQRVVVSLRDVHGLDAEEVCEVLGLSAANQRVLLHRARSRLRSLLEDYYRETLAGVPA